RRTENDNVVVLLTPKVVCLSGGEEAEAPPAKPVDPVQLNVMTFSVCDCFWKANAPWANLPTDALAFIDLNGTEFADTLKACEGCKVYAEPRLVTLTGTSGTFTIGDSHTLALTPTISADRQFVRLGGTVWGLEAAAGEPTLPAVCVPSCKAIVY